MYSSDRMKTLIILFKCYDKNVVFKDCQIHYSFYLFKKKRDPFNFLPSFCWTPCRNLYMINRYWTTFETIAEIERLQRTTTLHGSLWEIICAVYLLGWLNSLALFKAYMLSPLYSESLLSENFSFKFIFI